MTDTAPCPYCGAPIGWADDAPRGHSGSGALGALYREVRRIREIAESRVTGQTAACAGMTAGGPGDSRGDARDADLSHIAELTREVHELRATVARLRGSTGAAAVRSG